MERIPNELKKQAELFSKPLVDGYDDTDVIYEVIVKEGYGLNSRIEKAGRFHKQGIQGD